MMRKLIQRALRVKPIMSHKELMRFAEIEYANESPEYVMYLINSGQILKN